MFEHFCPNCWHEVPALSPICTNCGYYLTRYNELPEGTKLILCLSHPLKKYRLMAIKCLGDLGYENAIPVFGQIIDDGEDMTLIEEIFRSLVKINTLRSRAKLEALTSHHSKIIRSLAHATLKTFS